MTFSIVGVDPVAGSFGSAVASYSVAAGGTVSYSRLGVGVINTQHQAHLALGNRVLDEMEKGAAPHEALSRVLALDGDADSRQLIAIDTTGRQGGWTGRNCERERRHLFGSGCVVAGNHLATEDVVREMIHAFETASGRLGDRLLRSLEAGERAGGDRRGRKSAAVRVVPARPAGIAINLDLRVDDHEEPIRELMRLKDSFDREFG